MKLNTAERALAFAILSDFVMAFPIIGLGFLSGSAAATSEAFRAILLYAIDIFSFCILFAINRHKFSRFEFGVEKIQIFVQIAIAAGVCFSIYFVGAKIIGHFAGDGALPNFLFCILFAIFSTINVGVNSLNLSNMLAEYRVKRSIILRGQIKNRTIMLVSSVVATISAASVLIPDRLIFDIIDTIGAVVVLAVMLTTAARLLGPGLLSLLDAPMADRDKLHIFAEIADRFDHWDSIAFIRTRHVGHSDYAQVGLVFERSVTTAEAVAICRQIEEGIQKRLESSFVSVFPVSGRKGQEMN